MSFSDSIRSVYSNYAKFSGRAPRSEFWWFSLFFSMVYLLLIVPLIIVADESANSIGSVIFAIILVLFIGISIIPSLAVTVRRLHDAGFSGWWWFINLVPAGGIVLLVFTLLPSSQGDNKYGSQFGHVEQPQLA
jgi:uncharacterized membrane protein YhaH (DUF805 family)